MREEGQRLGARVTVLVGGAGWSKEEAMILAPSKAASRTVKIKELPHLLRP